MTTTTVPCERINLYRRFLRLHRDIRVLFYIGANSIEAPDAKELLFKAFDQLKAESPTLLRRQQGIA